uniref:Uncharacterized protein n=1 Tax=Strongyloides papillosus TaxID=174720 RepID=A0A0N5BSX4_STREA
MSKRSKSLPDQDSTGNFLRRSERIRRNMLPVEVSYAPKRRKTGSIYNESGVFEDSVTPSYLGTPVGTVTVKEATTQTDAYTILLVDAAVQTETVDQSKPPSQSSIDQLDDRATMSKGCQRGSHRKRSAVESEEDDSRDVAREACFPPHRSRGFPKRSRLQFKCDSPVAVETSFRIMEKGDTPRDTISNAELRESKIDMHYNWKRSRLSSLSTSDDETPRNRTREKFIKRHRRMVNASESKQISPIAEEVSPSGENEEIDTSSVEESLDSKKEIWSAPENQEDGRGSEPDNDDTTHSKTDIINN